MNSPRQQPDPSEVASVSHDAPPPPAAGPSAAQLLAAASHDLRQPLHALAFLAHATAKRVEGDATALDLVNRMKVVLATFQHQIDIHVDLARLESGKIVAEPRAAALAELIDQARDGLERGRRPSHTACATERPLVVRTDADLIRRIVRLLAMGADGLPRADVSIIGRSPPGAGYAEITIASAAPASSAPAATARMPDAAEPARVLARRICALLGHELAGGELSHGRLAYRIVLALDAADVPAAETSGDRAAGSLSGKTALILTGQGVLSARLAAALAELDMASVICETPAEANAYLAAGAPPAVALVADDLGHGDSGLAFVQRNAAVGARALPAIFIATSNDPVLHEQLKRSGARWLPARADPAVVAATVAGLLGAHAA